MGHYSASLPCFVLATGIGQPISGMQGLKFLLPETLLSLHTNHDPTLWLELAA